MAFPSYRCTFAVCSAALTRPAGRRALSHRWQRPHLRSGYKRRPRSRERLFDRRRICPGGWRRTVRLHPSAAEYFKFITDFLLCFSNHLPPISCSIFRSSYFLLFFSLQRLDLIDIGRPQRPFGDLQAIGLSKGECRRCKQIVPCHPWKYFLKCVADILFYFSLLIFPSFFLPAAATPH